MTRADDVPEHDSFAGMLPAEYHQWRLESELYLEVERPAILPVLEGIRFKRALDIGCGTGIWTCTLSKLQAGSLSVGIDLSCEMVEFASQQCQANFLPVDALVFKAPEPCDLIISGLSADYIGFSGFAKTVARNLSPSGVAYAWFIDPIRYPRNGSHRVKTWRVHERTVQVQIPDYDLIEIRQACAAAGLASAETRIAFKLRDGIDRTLVRLECTRL
jgi:SAM-dependent methyltransferase